MAIQCGILQQAKRLTVISLLLTVCSTHANAQAAQDSVVSRTLVDGVVHTHIRKPAGPWNIHVLEIDLKNPDVTITSARALDSLRGRETTSSIAHRQSRAGVHVVGAMNADFFNMQSGENDLSQVIEGEIVYAVRRPRRAQFAIDKSRRPLVDIFTFDGKLLSPRGTIPLHAVNSLKDSNANVLLTPYMRSYYPDKQELARTLRMSRRNGDTLTALAGDTIATSEQFIIGDSVMLLRSARSRENILSAGDSLSVVLQFSPRTDPLNTLVGGLPRIVVNGKNFAATDSLDGLSPRFTTARHPRSGVGFSKDSSVVYFVTVDGRQETSVGMSLAEFADLMLELGCYQGLNLDGGGSTTMVVEGSVVSLPSDPAGERPVANILMVVSRKK